MTRATDTPFEPGEVEAAARAIDPRSWETRDRWVREDFTAGDMEACGSITGPSLARARAALIAAARVRSAISMHHNQFATDVADTTAKLTAERDGWQPIETAPKDGTVVDLFYPLLGRVADARWTAELSMGWVTDGPMGETITRPNSELTHWRPLPPPPARNLAAAIGTETDGGGDG